MFSTISQAKLSVSQIQTHVNALPLRASRPTNISPQRNHLRRQKKSPSTLQIRNIIPPERRSTIRVPLRSTCTNSIVSLKSQFTAQGARRAYSTLTSPLLQNVSNVHVSTPVRNVPLRPTPCLSETQTLPQRHFHLYVGARSFFPSVDTEGDGPEDTILPHIKKQARKNGGFHLHVGAGSFAPHSRSQTNNQSKRNFSSSPERTFTATKNISSRIPTLYSLSPKLSQSNSFSPSVPFKRCFSTSPSTHGVYLCSRTEEEQSLLRPTIHQYFETTYRQQHQFDRRLEAERNTQLGELCLQTQEQMMEQDNGANQPSQDRSLEADRGIFCVKPRQLENTPLYMQWPTGGAGALMLKAAETIPAYTKILISAPLARTVCTWRRTVFCGHCHNKLASRVYKSKWSNHYFSNEFCRDQFDVQREPHARFFSELQNRIAIALSAESEFVFQTTSNNQHFVSCEDLNMMELLVDILVQDVFGQGNKSQVTTEDEVANATTEVGEVVHIPDSTELDFVSEQEHRLTHLTRDYQQEIRYLRLANILYEVASDNPDFGVILPPPAKLVNLMRSMDASRLYISRGLVHERVRTGSGIYPTAALLSRGEVANCHLYIDEHSNLVLMSQRQIEQHETIMCAKEDFEG